MDTVTPVRLNQPPRIRRRRENPQRGLCGAAQHSLSRGGTTLRGPDTALISSRARAQAGGINMAPVCGAGRCRDDREEVAQEDADLESPAKRLNIRGLGGFECTPVRTRNGAAYKRYQTIKQQPLTERNGDAHMEDAVPRPVAEPAGDPAVPMPAQEPASKHEDIAPVVLPDGPEPTQVEIQYLATEELTPLDDPASAVTALPDQLASEDWARAFDALLTLRRLAVHHADVAGSSMESWLAPVIRLVWSPRSQLSKAALLCARDLAAILGAAPSHLDGGGLEDPSTSLLHQILLKATSTDKKFVVKEAEATLGALARGLPLEQTVELLAPYAVRHKNFKVRGKAGACIAAVVVEAAAIDDGLLARLRELASSLMNDKVPEARDAARKMGSKLAGQ